MSQDNLLTKAKQPITNHKIYWLILLNVICIVLSNILAAKTFTLYAFGSGTSYTEVLLPASIVLFTCAIIISDILCKLNIG